MSPKHTTASRLLAVFALTTLSLTTVAEAQSYASAKPMQPKRRCGMPSVPTTLAC